MEGLQELGCFEIVAKEMADGHRLYWPRFVDKVKESAEKKSRLCVAAVMTNSMVCLPEHLP